MTDVILLPKIEWQRTANLQQHQQAFSELWSAGVQEYIKHVPDLDPMVKDHYSASRLNDWRAQRVQNTNPSQKHKPLMDWRL